MVSKLRLCRATQSARASASATVPMASTSTASYSPKIKVDVMGSKPSASPKGRGRSPTIVFPGAVKTFTLSVLDSTGVATGVVSFTPIAPSIWYSCSELGASDCAGCQNIGNRSESAFHPRRALTVGEVSALSDLNNVAVRIADIAADLAVLRNRLRDELGSPAFP